jgi:hypothetical protein
MSQVSCVLADDDIMLTIKPGQARDAHLMEAKLTNTVLFPAAWLHIWGESPGLPSGNRVTQGMNLCVCYNETRVLKQTLCTSQTDWMVIFLKQDQPLYNTYLAYKCWETDQLLRFWRMKISRAMLQRWGNSS